MHDAYGRCTMDGCARHLTLSPHSSFIVRLVHELLDGALRQLGLVHARQRLVRIERWIERLDQLDQEVLGHAPVGQARRELALVLLVAGSDLSLQIS